MNLQNRKRLTGLENNFMVARGEGGVKGRDTVVVLGDLIDWSARKNMNVKQSLIIKYKSKDILD